MNERDALINDGLLEFLEPDERRRLIALLDERGKALWKPQKGPQTDAYYSSADIIGYGGAAGGGKTDLAVGLAVNEHQKVGIFRQTGTELTAIRDRIGEILGGRDQYNGGERIWRFKRRDGVSVQVELGSFPNPGDEKKYQGRPHDLLVFDEAANMREAAVRFLLGWLRTVDTDQRKRALLCFNPPTTVEGRWIVEFFAPWIDKDHPNPALPGEIRWFATIDKREVEVKGPDPFKHKGKVITPQSRTFIASRVADNQFLAGTNYEMQLQQLPEPLRSQMLYGDFTAGMEDDPYQVIPTAWVDLAMERWTKPGVLPAMDSIGMDVAMGGDDNTIIIRRHGMWFDTPIVYQGRECKDGPTIAGYALAAMRDSAPIHVDLFGVGAQPYAHLRETGHQTLGINVGDKTGGTTRDGAIGFLNRRSELWWRMREALDPAANTGIALPPDPQLKADLCAPKWELRNAVIKVQSREDIVKNIGRSPDWGSAACLALIDTMKMGHARQLLRGSGQEYDPFRDL